MGIDDEFRNAQAQAAAFGMPGETAVHLIEPPEYLPGRPARYPSAVIANAKTNRAVFAENFQLNPFVIIRVFVRVVQQVDKHRDHGVAVRQHVRQILRNIHFKPALSHAEFGLDRLCSVAGNRRGARRGHHEGLLIAFHPRKGQEIIDQPGEPLVFFRDELQIFGNLPLVPVVALQQGIYQHAHGRQRRLQFVRNRGDEIVLELVCFYLLSHRLRRQQSGGNHYGDSQQPRPDIYDLLPVGRFFKDVNIPKMDFNLPAREEFPQRRPDKGGLLWVLQTRGVGAGVVRYSVGNTQILEVICNRIEIQAKRLGCLEQHAGLVAEAAIHGKDRSGQFQPAKAAFGPGLE